MVQLPNLFIIPIVRLKRVRCLLSKIDTKLFAVVLTVGLLSGYVINNFVVSGPKINSLTEENTEQQNQIVELISEKIALEDEILELQEDYDNLESSLEQEISDLETEIRELDNEILSQEEEIEFNELYIDQLNQYINELSYNITVLESKYEELYNPLEIEYVIDDIKYKISILDDVYPDTVPIKGNVEIQYLDGTDFVGTFKLEVTKIYIGTRFASDLFVIDGSTNYLWNGAFLLGPGSYKLYISEIKDSNENIVSTYSDLRQHALYLFVG